MLFRIVNFLLFQTVGAALGWWLGQMPGALIATLAGTWCWFVSDLWRGNKVVSWLKVGDTNHTPHL